MVVGWQRPHPTKDVYTNGYSKCQRNYLKWNGAPDDRRKRQSQPSKEVFNSDRSSSSKNSVQHLFNYSAVIRKVMAFSSRAAFAGMWRCLLRFASLAWRHDQRRWLALLIICVADFQVKPKDLVLVAFACLRLFGTCWDCQTLQWVLDEFADLQAMAAFGSHP